MKTVVLRESISCIFAHGNVTFVETIGQGDIVEEADADDER